MLNGYAGDVSGIRGKTTLDPTTGMLQADSSLDTETSGMLERVNKLRRGVKEMDAAMAAWKEVLNRDVKQSMDAMSALFGGDAVATFSGSGDILQRMALRVRHTAALTGNEAGYIMGGVGNTMRMFDPLGAPQGFFDGGTLATSFAANLGGYRGDQGSMEQRTALSIGHAVASPYGRLIAGAYVRYLGSEQGYSWEGVGSQSREGFRRLIEGYRGENGFTAESLNAALATVGVEAVSDRDYRRRADTDVGSDYLSQDAYVATETFLESNRRARRTFLSRDKNAAAVAAAMGEGAFFTAMGLNPGDREAAIRGAWKARAGMLIKSVPPCQDCGKIPISSLPICYEAVMVVSRIETRICPPLLFFFGQFPLPRKRSSVHVKRKSMPVYALTSIGQRAVLCWKQVRVC